MGYKRNATTGEMEPTGLLELDVDPRNPSVYADEQMVIPEPEKHFAFSITLMVMAVELYLETVPAICKICIQETW